MIKTSERRQSIRAKRVLSIQFRLVKPKRARADYDWHLSTTYDMSISGVGFYSDIEYKINDILQIEIVMSGTIEIFKGHAKVVRIQRRGTGGYYFIAVKVSELKPKQRAAKTYKKKRSERRKTVKK